MRHFTRGEEPEVLKNNWKRIGQEYQAKRAADASYSFNWPQINNVKLNHSILPHLIFQTQGHCSYCDKFPLYRRDDSIDHFKPKSDERFYTLVCKWHNLYLCCTHCQDAKKTGSDENLLRPDDDGYSFNRYFVYNYSANTIEINEGLTPDEIKRAEVTRKIFDVNHDALIKARENAIFRYVYDRNVDLDTYEFRFLFE